MRRVGSDRADLSPGCSHEAPHGCHWLFHASPVSRSGVWQSTRAYFYMVFPTMRLSAITSACRRTGRRAPRTTSRKLIRFARGDGTASLLSRITAEEVQTGAELRLQHNLLRHPSPFALPRQRLVIMRGSGTWNPVQTFRSGGLAPHLCGVLGIRK